MAVIVQSPDGHRTVYHWPGSQVTHDSVGKYHVVIAVPKTNTPAAVGTWVVNCSGVGGFDGVGEATFVVVASKLT